MSLSRTRLAPRKTRRTASGPADADGNLFRLRRHGDPPRVLVVEDNIDARLILEEALTSAGYAVTVAKNGIEALALLRAVPVDLMVIDLQMPELGGKPTIRAVRALGGRLAKLPIVVVSAFAPPSLPGVQAVIPKPAPLDVLVERIAELLAVPPR